MQKANMKNILNKNKKYPTACNVNALIEPAGRRGLTFIELLVAVAIMSILTMTIVAVAIAFLNNRTAVKRYQANNEELSLALNSLAKDIRMSDFNVVPALGSSISSINLKNNATGNVVVYTFNAGSPATLSRAEIISGVTTTYVVASDVTGSFFVRGTKIGRITTVLVKAGPPGMTAQTTVSMRAKYKDEN
ncbi:MAG: prepilin-type N-terminal cleavage/methylation domain-containing protein [Candidatus Moraniibacteriota bacterium]